MTKLRLSGAALDGLKALNDLQADVFDSLIKSFRDHLSIKLGIDDDLEKLISDLLPEGANIDARALAAGIMGAHFVLINSHRTPQEFADDLAETLASDSDQSSRRTLSARFSSLLELPAVHASAKAWSLLEENDNIYLDSRIITDLRPVFGHEVSGVLYASLITHTVRITARSNNRRENSFFVLDDEDIKSLIKQLDRALLKSAFLRRIIKEYPNQQLGKSLEGSEE